MSKYEWVTKSEYRPVKREIETILKRVIAIMEKEYDFPDIRYQLIGSGSRHLVTRIKNGNKGFDLDYNIILPALDEGYVYKPKPKVIADRFVQAFTKACQGTSYEFPKHRTSVIQLKCIDQKQNKILYGADFAIVYYGADKSDGYYYLRHWDDGHYTFEKRKHSRNADWKLEEILEYNSEQGWNWIREEYLKLKNNNHDQGKHSYVLYLESIHNVYNQIQQAQEKEDVENGNNYDSHVSNINHIFLNNWWSLNR